MPCVSNERDAEDKQAVKPLRSIDYLTLKPQD